MVEFKDLIPEISSFVMGLILTASGVPSIADLGIIIISAFQNTMNTMPNVPAQAYFISSTYIIALRILGAFLEIEFPLRIIIWFSRRREGNYQ
jgi:hypothetical protein